jgi:RND family efflux transporter MFP subunit
MSGRWLRGAVGGIAAAALVAGAVFVHRELSDEAAREAESEKAVRPPSRVRTGPGGETIVDVEEDMQALLGIACARAEAPAGAPELALPARIEAAPGRIVALRAPLAGTAAAARPIEVGAAVEAGEVLLRIAPALGPGESAGLVARVAEARGAVAAAVAEREVAERALQRARSLVAGEGVSERALDEAAARLGAATARLDAARTAEAAYLAAGASELRAPISGRVTAVSDALAAGTLVLAGEMLLEIAAPGPLRVEAVALPGTALPVPLPATARVLPLEPAPATPTACTLLAAPPPLDPETHGQRLVYGCDGPALRPGAAATLLLPLPAPAPPAALVPADAIVRDIGRTLVYLCPAKGSFTAVPVRIIAAQGDRALVSGVAPGAVVVSEGAAILFSEERKAEIRLLEDEEGD